MAGYERSDFLYYDVCSSQSCDLGWYTVYKGQEFLIYEKWGKMERGELIFTYRLGKPGLGWGRKRYNDKISGMTILGEVLSTERETVRLKLDIDEGWNPGGPYPYTWRPETGNMMYCMPQVGTRVSLYFPNYDEQMAMAVNCVRTNGGSCTRMSDPSKRSFVTEHGKEMNLYPQEMSLLGGANGMVKLADETGISISTDKRIQIVAQQAVQVNGKTVVMSAPLGELAIANLDAFSGIVTSSFVQSNQYDILGMTTNAAGRICQVFEPFDDAPQEGSFDWGSLIGNVIAGLAVVGAVAFTIGTLGAGAPMVIGALAVGSFFIVRKGVNDYKAGEVSSTISYMVTGLFWAAVGAVAAGGFTYGLSTIRSMIDAIKSISWIFPPPSFGLGLVNGGAMAAEGIIITGEQIVNVIGTALAGSLLGSLLLFSKGGGGSSRPTSHKVWQRGSTERVEVENYNNGRGNIHYHDPQNKKWYYDLAQKIFVDENGVKAPPRIQKLLKDSEIYKAIQKAIKYFSSI